MILNNRNALPYRYRIFSGARYTKDNEDTISGKKIAPV